jgi:Gram-negative bacterial TonB protein C-terminal
MDSRRFHWLSAVLFLAFATLSSRAQTSASWTEWETLSPVGEEFSVLMPKNPSTETAKFPYHRMELTSRLYLSAIPNGPVLAIASFSGIKSNPAQYSDLQRFNSYVDAFRNWFPAKATGKDGVAKLTLVGNHSFHGYDGREYKVTIGELTGILHAYATKKRFYAIVSLNLKSDDAAHEKFLSSFILPDKPAEVKIAAGSQPDQGPPTLEVQVSEAPARAGSNPERPNGDAPGSPTQARPGDDNAGEGTQPNTIHSLPKRGPINGGILNSKAIYLPSPYTPPGETGGVVLVQVMIDEQGAVVEARAISGPQHLHAAAVTAARLARFTPTLLMGEPVKVTGTLTYNFAKPD